MQQVLISLNDDSGDDDQLAQLSHELASDLRAEDGIVVSRPPSAGAPGQKGELLTIGSLIVELAGSTAIASLIAVLKVYLARKRTLAVELRRGDGASLKISGSYLKIEEVDNVLHRLSSFLKE